jgi:prepilin-type N-terminal cleavage/methylation domain-containing protein
MLKQLNKREKGFTIIEVLIVLAIAGVIMLVVFLAVPALQRNSHNTTRKSDVAHLAGLINEYAANNTGALPTSIVAGAAAVPPAANTLYLNNDKFSIEDVTTNQPTATIPATLPTTIDQTFVYTKAVCNGNTPTASGSTRTAVIYYVVEGTGGNTGQCTGI